jgi:small subunit ribosomal protein S4
MSRYTGPTTRINRRFGMAIFPPTKAFERKPHLPGVHGPRLRRKTTGYSVGLIEKQKLRYLYGLNETQFRIAFNKAKHERGVTADEFVSLLEMRLDSVIYLLGFAKTRRQARQYVNHGHFRVNGKKVDIASYLVKVGDEVDVRPMASARQIVTRALEENKLRAVPAWMSRQDDALKGIINRAPNHEELETGVNVQEIVEFYSR